MYTERNDNQEKVLYYPVVKLPTAVNHSEFNITWLSIRKKTCHYVFLQNVWIYLFLEWGAITSVSCKTHILLSMLPKQGQWFQ
jgi:hypothetical protein